MSRSDLNDEERRYFSNRIFELEKKLNAPEPKMDVIRSMARNIRLELRQYELKM